MNSLFEVFIFSNSAMYRMAELVEYCLGNVDKKARKVLQNSAINTRECRCLDHCGKCYESKFAVVDGTIVADEDYIELINKTSRQV